MRPFMEGWRDRVGSGRINHPFHTRVVLHENDHLEGKVFLQRMKEGDFPKLYWEENLDIRKRNSE